MPERQNGKDASVACKPQASAHKQTNQDTTSDYPDRMIPIVPEIIWWTWAMYCIVLQDLEAIAFSHTRKQIHEETDRPDKQGVQVDRQDSTNKKWLQGKNGRVQSLRMTRLTRFQSQAKIQPTGKSWNQQLCDAQGHEISPNNTSCNHSSNWVFKDCGWAASKQIHRNTKQTPNPNMNYLQNHTPSSGNKTCPKSFSTNHLEETQFKGELRKCQNRNQNPPVNIGPKSQEPFNIKCLFIVAFLLDSG